MSNNLEVHPDELRAYGATTGAIAGELTAAAGIDLATNLAAMTPAFGLIGAGFVAAFGAAQANHAKAFGDVAANFAAQSAMAHAGAARYENLDSGAADKLGAAGAELGA